MNDDLLAEIMHLGWVGFQIAAGQPYNEIPSEDQLKSLHDAIKNREGKTKLSPEEEHDNWMRFKLADGWKYGKVKDETAKTHPDILPFEELPEIEQRKDTNSIIIYKNAMRILEKYIKETK